MCIIIVRQPGESVPLDRLQNGWVSNPDGGGYAFVDHNGTVQVRKGLMTFDAWMDSYIQDEDEHGDHSPFIIHFRIGTHGPNDESNTHPHKVSGNLVMAHNGVIRGLTFKPKDKRSDTRVFIDDILRFLPRGWLNNPAIVELVEDRIGASKLVFLNGQPGIYDSQVHILNSHLGHWEKNGNWYSNRSADRCGWKQVSSSKVVRGPGVTTVTPAPFDRDDEWTRPYQYQADDHQLVNGVWVHRDDLQTMMFPREAAAEKAATATPTTSFLSRGFEHSPSTNPDTSECPLCEREVLISEGEWCWKCLWCAACDQSFSACDCVGWKAKLAWDHWGEDYLARLEKEDQAHDRKMAEVAELMAAIGEPVMEPVSGDKSIHEMSDEEVASLG